MAKHIIEDLELTEGQLKHALKRLKEQDKIESIVKGKKHIIKKIKYLNYLDNSKTKSF